MPSSYRGGNMLTVLNLPPSSRENVANSPNLACACAKVGVINFVPEHPLGIGGFSNVYKVDKKRVVKIFKPNVSDKMLLREINMIGYENQYIIKTIECTATPLGCGVMLERGEIELYEYMQQHFIREGYGIGLDGLTVESFFVDLIEGICFLHNEGIYHCDLKPENIMLKSGQLKICDFGLSHCNQWKDGKQNPIGSLASLDGMFGTPAYMPPVSIADKTPLLRDEWALGVILFVLAYGRMLSDNIYHLATKDPGKFASLNEISTHKNEYAGTAKEYEKNYSSIDGGPPRADVEYYLKYLLRQVPMEINKLKKQITESKTEIDKTDIEFWLLSEPEPPPKRSKK